ncbi:MAG TPA: DinB family protein [Chryseolinea sp.]|nr:DinB family protein [Chryseolinea sp.]
MQRKEILINGWDFAYDVEGWYPPLKASLKDVDLTQAQWKPEGASSHSIAALVNHLLYYKKRFLYRLEHRDWTITIESNDETFRTTTYANAEAWNNAVTELQSINESIREKLVRLEDANLDSPLPKDPIDEQVLHLVMHDAYHTGQIVQIRKLYGSWPSVREV